MRVEAGLWPDWDTRTDSTSVGRWPGCGGAGTVRVIGGTPKLLEQEPFPGQKRGFPGTGEGLRFQTSDPHQSWRG